MYSMDIFISINSIVRACFTRARFFICYFDSLANRGQRVALGLMELCDVYFIFGDFKEVLFPPHLRRDVF